jgi:hypothetical protein
VIAELNSVATKVSQPRGHDPGRLAGQNKRKNARKHDNDGTGAGVM